jgi:hypothetical protein
MDTMTATVLILVIVLFCILMFFALISKGDVKAGASVGHSSFFFEARESRRLRRTKREATKEQRKGRVVPADSQPAIPRRH